MEFLKIAAVLYATRFIAAALMGPGLESWDPQLFNLSYKCIGNNLTSWAIVSAVIGVLMIAAAIILQYKKDKGS